MSVDTKQSLRKLDFPLCVKEALARIEQLCSVQNLGRLQSIKQADSAMELIAEFVFCEVDRQRARIKRLSSLQELQLLEVLCDYFAYSSVGSDVGEATRNTVFMSLFPHTHVDRCQIFIKLISIAISTSNIPLLTSTGVLMQQVGCTSKFTMELAKGLVNDYIILMPSVVDKLFDLPIKAPLFTANFLVGLTEIYYNNDNESVFVQPSDVLLEVVTHWVSEYPSLCFTALTSNLLPALPHGAILMPAITPFLGLLKWCIFAPLCSNDNILYSKLHLSVIESLLESPNQSSSSTSRIQCNAISAQNLSLLIACYNIRLNTILKESGNPNVLSENVLLSLERLSQFIQISLWADSIYGSKQDLFNKLKLLPEVRILKILLMRNKEII